jgi:hypothetical protein
MGLEDSHEREVKIVKEVVVEFLWSGKGKIEPPPPQI